MFSLVFCNPGCASHWNTLISARLLSEMLVPNVPVLRPAALELHKALQSVIQPSSTALLETLAPRVSVVDMLSRTSDREVEYPQVVEMLTALKQDRRWPEDPDKLIPCILIAAGDIAYHPVGMPREALCFLVMIHMYRRALCDSDLNISADLEGPLLLRLVCDGPLDEVVAYARFMAWVNRSNLWYDGAVYDTLLTLSMSHICGKLMELQFSMLQENAGSDDGDPLVAKLADQTEIHDSIKWPDILEMTLGEKAGIAAWSAMVRRALDFAKNE